MVPLVPRLGCASGGCSRSRTCQPPLWWTDPEVAAPGGSQSPVGDVAATRVLPGSPSPWQRHPHQPSPTCPGEQRQILAIHPFEVTFSSSTCVGSRKTTRCSRERRAGSPVQLPAPRWWPSFCKAVTVPGAAELLVVGGGLSPPHLPRTHPDRSGVFPEGSFLAQEREIAMIAASRRGGKPPGDKSPGYVFPFAGRWRRARPLPLGLVAPRLSL